MAEQFKYLFTPIKIGPVTVRNRVVSTPHGTSYAQNCLPIEQLAYYHAERAKGGAGLIEVEGVFVAPESDSYMMPNNIRIHDEASIPGLRQVVDMCHEHGAKVFVELLNWGISHGKGPSVMPDLWFRVTAREMTVAEIAELVEWYGISAENAKKAGFDGVEIHASHGFGVQQFNSPLWNRRTDKYGGPLENRATFMLEVVDRIKKVIGDGLALGVRLDADDLFPGGSTLEDGKKMARILEGTGKIDYISVDLAFEPHQAHIMTAPMYAPVGHQIPHAAAIKEVLEKIPVITAGRIIDPIFAEKILAEGQADLVGMTRAQIADPELANKARAGRLDDIRPCLGDNENCMQKVGRSALMCTGNPRTGRESKLGLDPIHPAKVKKNVLVVGGGPAGMEAARVAALRGHKVTLYEKTRCLGGQVNLAALLPGRDEIGGIARWLEGQITKLGVEVHLGDEVTTDKARALKPDSVIVATGAAFFRDGTSAETFKPIAGWDNESVTTPEEILSGRKIAGNKVVIVDQTGFIIGLGVAEFLANQGKAVQILTSDPSIGAFLAPSLQFPWVYARIMGKVALTPHTLVKEISDHTVTTLTLHSFQEGKIEEVDTVVLATAKKPNDSLYHALQGSGLEVHVIGDANYAVNANAGIGQAIRAGHDLSLQL